MAKVAVYVMNKNGLAQLVVPKMAAGAKAAGDEITTFTDDDFVPEHLETFDTAIFWGYIEPLQAIMKGYTGAGKSAVYLDLGYWERGTHYKVAINARHPTAYFQKFKHDDSRSKQFNVKIKPYRKTGEIILLAGLSAKAAWAEHEGPWGAYETKAVEEIQKHTKRPIVYRAKAHSNAVEIPGTKLSTLKEPLGPLLKRAWAVVTRHSNVAVDGLLEGVPAFCWYGVGSVMALQDVSRIEDPWYPEGREQWVNDIAYCQWSLDEMKDGTCWRHLKSEGLVR